MDCMVDMAQIITGIATLGTFIVSIWTFVWTRRNVIETQFDKTFHGSIDNLMRFMAPLRKKQIFHEALKGKEAISGMPIQDEGAQEAAYCDDAGSKCNSTPDLSIFFQQVCEILLFIEESGVKCQKKCNAYTQFAANLSSEEQNVVLYFAGRCKNPKVPELANRAFDGSTNRWKLKSSAEVLKESTVKNSP